MSGVHPLLTASQEDRARLQEDDDLFEFQLRRLRAGSATASPDSGAPRLQTIDEATIDLVGTMAKRARTGQLIPTMAAMLATYLDGLTAPERFALLGISKTNRPTTKSGQETSAVLAFTDALRRGLDNASALIEAYDAYFAAGPLPKVGAGRRTYAIDLATPKDKKSRFPNHASSTMASTIIPTLQRMKLIPKRAKGPKPK